jgi:hypothetical protein
MISIVEIILPADIQRQIGSAAKAARLAQNHTRETAASLTGVPAPTLKVFENTGNISLKQLVLVCRTYGKLEPLLSLFEPVSPQSLDDLIAGDAPPRQRGRH